MPIFRKLFVAALLVALAITNACSVATTLKSVGEKEFGRGLISKRTAAGTTSTTKRYSGAATGSGVDQSALEKAELYLAAADPPAANGQQRRPISINDDRDATLNFVNAQLTDVVDILLGDILQQNYAMSPQVQGTVTVRSNGAVPNRDILAVLENLLALNGASIVRATNIWHVVPFDETQSLPNVVVRPSQKVIAGGHGVHFIRLENSAVASVIDVVAAHANPGRQITADPDRNLIIFVGPTSEARAIEEMVSVLDIDTLRGKSFALIPVKVASVNEVVENLDSVFGPDKSKQIQFVGIDRMAAIMAISRNKKLLRKAQQWVGRFDRVDVHERLQVFVYHVRNGRAEDLAELVAGLYPGSSGPRDRSTIAPGLQSVTLTQDIETRSEAKSASPSHSAGISKIKPTPTIMADKRNNALVIKCTPEDYKDIEAILSRLDIVPLQVLIEVIVAEVSLDGDLEFGVEWYLKSGSIKGVFSTLASGAVKNVFPGFGVSFETSDAKIVLNALNSITDVDVISSPKLMVLDNQSARLQVGDQVPVATRSAVSVDTDNAPVVNTVELIDTGVILEVTPTVNTGGMVSLNVAQEVSEATTTRSSKIDSPTIQTRKIQSMLAVQSGETVALAGMMRERQENGETGVPGLRKMPIVGALFRNRTQRTRRTELIVLITPHVVRDPNEMRRLTRDLKDSLSLVSNF